MGHSVTDLAHGLESLGLKRGDVVLVTASLRAMGEVDEERPLALIHALLEVVGAEGTIVGLAFNQSFLFPWRHRNHVVTERTQPITGGFAAALVSWPGALRSLHPTNSFVALGRLAQEVVAGHDETATCFQPIQRLLDYDGKMALVGCVESCPGFSTVHLAQERLGLATRSILSGRQGVYFEREGEIRLFRRLDIPGCSRGFYKLYSQYLQKAILTVGHVGDAYSIAANLRQTFDVDRQVLARDPRSALCDDPRCFSCRGTRLYNKRDMPRYFLSQMPVLVNRTMSRLHRSTPAMGEGIR